MSSLTRWSTRFRRLAALGVIAAAFASASMAGARPAQAHSDLLGTEPRYGGTLTAGQREVHLSFDEAVDLKASSISLIGTPPPKRGPEASHPGPDGREVRVRLPALPTGEYFLRWFMLSAVDGHVIGGELAFKARPAGGEPPSPPPAPGPAVVPPAPAAAVAPAASPGGRFAATAAATSSPGPTPEPAPDNGAGTESSAVIPAYALSTGNRDEAAGDDDRGASAAGLFPAGAGATGQRAGLAGVETLCRLAGSLALMILTGGLAFICRCWPQGAGLARSRRLLAAASVVGIGATALGIGLKSTALRGLPLTSALDPTVAVDLLGTSVGRVLASRMLLIAVLAAVAGGMLHRPERTLATGWRMAATTTGLGALATYGMTGHPRAGGTLASLASFAHLAGAATWFGGLVFLAAVLLPRRDPEDAAPVVASFSRTAFAAVAVMGLSGTVLLLLVGPGLGGMVGSGYGKVLLVKLAFVAAVLVAAGRARRFTQRHLVTPGSRPASLRPLAGAVATELVLGLGVLAATAALVGRSPNG